jgi:tRNA-uridine 2-sulfurtransferase
MSIQKKIVVGISGGVDSAVSACLLAREGYAVTGLNIRVLDTIDEAPSLQPSPLVISDHPDFRIPVFSLNLSGRFREEVIRYFHEEYLGGRTPNPCMVCNKRIKWFGLFEGAKLLGADYVATGHFAGTSFIDGRYRLYKGADPEKDQSYFLWMLTQDDLSRTVFPLGRLTKPEVRALARSFGVKAAEKKESQEICFVPQDDYCSYLKNAIPDLGEKVAGGEIIDEKGKVIGRHQGYPFYTIGQRRGLGVSSNEPLYINAIEPEHNRIHVGRKTSLESRKIFVSGLNWIGIDTPGTTMNASVKIRYRDKETPCFIEPLPQNAASVTFESPKNAVASGQAAVFYRDREVLGGGFISGTINHEQQ